MLSKLALLLNERISELDTAISRLEECPPTSPTASSDVASVVANSPSSYSNEFDGADVPRNSTEENNGNDVDHCVQEVSDEVRQLLLDSQDGNGNHDNEEEMFEEQSDVDDDVDVEAVAVDSSNTDGYVTDRRAGYVDEYGRYHPSAPSSPVSTSSQPQLSMSSWGGRNDDKPSPVSAGKPHRDEDYDDDEDDGVRRREAFGSGGGIDEDDDDDVDYATLAALKAKMGDAGMYGASSGSGGMGGNRFGDNDGIDDEDESRVDVVDGSNDDEAHVYENEDGADGMMMMMDPRHRQEGKHDQSEDDHDHYDDNVNDDAESGKLVDPEVWVNDDDLGYHILAVSSSEFLAIEDGGILTGVMGRTPLTWPQQHTQNHSSRRNRKKKQQHRRTRNHQNGYGDNEEEDDAFDVNDEEEEDADEAGEGKTDEERRFIGPTDIARSILFRPRLCLTPQDHDRIALWSDLEARQFRYREAVRTGDIHPGILVGAGDELGHWNVQAPSSSSSSSSTNASSSSPVMGSEGGGDYDETDSAAAVASLPSMPSLPSIPSIPSTRSPRSSSSTSSGMLTRTSDNGRARRHRHGSKTDLRASTQEDGLENSSNDDEEEENRSSEDAGSDDEGENVYDGVYDAKDGSDDQEEEESVLTTDYDGLEGDLAAAEAVLGAGGRGMMGLDRRESNNSLDRNDDDDEIHESKDGHEDNQSHQLDMTETIQDEQDHQQQPQQRQEIQQEEPSPPLPAHPILSKNGYFNLRVVFEPHRTGFEEKKDFQPAVESVIAGKYRVDAYLGQAAFSTALQCLDMASPADDPMWVCLKVIKNNKEFFDQSLDEIKLLQYINSRGDADDNHVLRLLDFFYYKEHLFIVSELLRENLYDFQRYLRDNGQESYFTLPRLQKIMLQVLEALRYIHSLGLIHCDIKPENIVIKSYSRCEVKLIDFGSSCYTHDHLTSYIQSRSYRAPEVILGLPYDGRVDVWSLGTVLAELYTGYVLFQNDHLPGMIARMSGIVGPFPNHMIAAGRESTKLFTSSGVVYHRVPDTDDVHLMTPKRTSLKERLHCEDETFLDFTSRLLDIDPLARPDANAALSHPFLQDIDMSKVMYVAQ